MNNSLKQEARLNAAALKKHLQAQRRNPPCELEQLRFQAANALSRLRRLAETDLRALEVLATELRLHIRGMKHDAISKPEHYRKLISKCAVWPAFVSVDREIQSDQRQFAEVMRLGTDTPLNYSGRQWSRGTPEIRAALCLIDWIQHRGDNLPPLKRSTAKQWWKHARPMFEEIYGEHFENHPLFSESYKLNPGRKQQAEDKGLKFETWQRQQILSKMAQAFRNIAHKG